MKLSHISRNMNKKGFTLIELLIVIGILGILAAGLLAAIDPLDQLRRGRDSTRRTIAVEFTNAMNRFYAQTGVWPWGTTADTAYTNITAGATLAALTAANELKSSFAAGIPANSTIIFAVSNGAVYTCFQQEGRAPNAADVYVATGPPPTTGAACSGASGGTACYFCAR